MHSDTYYGQDFSDGLTHWKYIKRYEVGGRYRYVYANKETHNRVNKKFKEAERNWDSAEFFKQRAADTDVNAKNGGLAYRMRKEAQKFNEEKASNAYREAESIISENFFDKKVGEFIESSARLLETGKDFIKNLFKKK